MSDPIQEMLSAGAPTLSFADASMNGKWVKGRVVMVEKSQQRDMVTKAPKFYDEEKQRPMWQYVITLQTDQVDPGVEDDDGTRRLFAKGQMIGAIAHALKKAGVTDTASAVGGMLAVRWNGNGEGKPGLNPPKLYEAAYKPGDATADLAAEPEAQPEPVAYDDPDEEPF